MYSMSLHIVGFVIGTCALNHLVKMINNSDIQLRYRGHDQDCHLWISKREENCAQLQQIVHY